MLVRGGGVGGSYLLSRLMGRGDASRRVAIKDVGHKGQAFAWLGGFRLSARDHGEERFAEVWGRRQRSRGLVCALAFRALRGSSLLGERERGIYGPCERGLHHPSQTSESVRLSGELQIFRALSSLGLESDLRCLREIATPRKLTLCRRVA